MDGRPGHQVKAESVKNRTSAAFFHGRAGQPGQRRFTVLHLREGLAVPDRQYTVFGEVVSGMDVADKIVSQPRDPRDNPNERIENERSKS